jgi:hypothetical protein
VQTFVPDNNFGSISSVLDRQRLGKQRVESWQILNTLGHIDRGDLYMTDKRGVKRKRGWTNHPAVLMWKGNEWFLCLYSEAICKEWIGRGYKDTMLERFEGWRENNPNVSINAPLWWGDELVHRSHRSKLLEKNYDHYKGYFPLDEAGMDYHWPI